MSLILSGSDGVSDIDGTAATPAIRGTDANTGMFFPAADTIAFSEGGVEAMRIDSSGIVLIGRTTAVNLGEGAGIQAYPAGYLYATVSNDAPGGFSRRDSNGSIVLFRRDTTNVGTIDVTTTGTTYTGTNGVTFTATQSSSANANTLDDYEEGQWTPAITNGITSPTYSNQTGYYTKIGDVVNFSFRIYLSGGTRNGSLLTFTLPFVGKSTGMQAGAGVWAYASAGVVNSTSTNLPTLYINSGASEMYCYSTAGGSFIGTDLAGATPDIYISGSYLTTT